MPNVWGPIRMATTFVEYKTNLSFTDFKLCKKMDSLPFNEYETLAGLDQCAWSWTKSTMHNRKYEVNKGWN